MIFALPNLHPKSTKEDGLGIQKEILEVMICFQATTLGKPVP